jgi:hypothetical protein
VSVIAISAGTSTCERNRASGPLTVLIGTKLAPRDPKWLRVRFLAHLSSGLVPIWNGIFTSRTGWSIPPGCDGASRPSVRR